MIKTFSFNPLIILLISSIIQTLIFISFIFTRIMNNWNDFINSNVDQIKLNSKIKYNQKIIVKLLKNFYFSIFGTSGIILSDTGFFWLIGGWNYLDWKYQFINSVICLIIGIECILFVYFYDFDYLKLTAFLSSLILYEIAIHILLPKYIIMEIFLKLAFPIVLIYSIFSYFILTSIKYFYKRKNILSEKKLLRFLLVQKIFNFKICFIIWIFSVIQTILCYFGSSLLNFFLI